MVETAVGSAIVTIPVPPITGNGLVSMGAKFGLSVDASELHITLLHIPELGAEAREKLQKALSKVEVSGALELQGHGRFTKGKKDVLFLIYTAWSLQETYRQVREVADRLNISYSQDYMFYPHVTLAYVHKEFPNIPLQDAPEWQEYGNSVDYSIEIWQNGERYSNRSAKMEMVILKSLRTQDGAETWAKARGLENVKVVHTNDVMKHYGYDVVSEIPVEHGYHVVENYVTPVDTEQVMEAVKQWEDENELVKSLVSAGLVKVTDFGSICMTDKWYEIVDTFQKSAIERALKSMGTADKAPEVTATEAETPTPPENDDFGAEAAEIEGVSDEEATKLTDDGSPGDVDLQESEYKPEGISDAEADAQIHKSTTIVGTVFKSLNEAQEWENPDMSVYHILPISAHEKDQYGEGAKYVVKAKEGAYVPEVSNVDDEIQGTAEAEPVVETTEEILEEQEPHIFKSLMEAREFANTDSSYFVRSTDLHEKREYGNRFLYIVERTPEREPVGAMGNRPVR